MRKDYTGAMKKQLLLSSDNNLEIRTDLDDEDFKYRKGWGLQIQEGQPGPFREPHLCTSTYSGERCSRSYQAKDCQHLGCSFVEALNQAETAKAAVAQDTKGGSDSKVGYPPEVQDVMQLKKSVT